MNEFETWFPHEFLTILSNPCVLFANPIHRKYDHFVILQNKHEIQGAKWEGYGRCYDYILKNALEGVHIASSYCEPTKRQNFSCQSP
jgi:hypothetical protein